MAKLETLDEYKKWYSKLSSRLESMLMIEEEMRRTTKGFTDKEIKGEAELVFKVLGQVHQIQEQQELNQFRG